MPDFRHKKRLSQMLRKPHLVRAHAAMVIAQNKFMIEQIMDLSKKILSPSAVRDISKKVYGDEMTRFEKLKDDAVIAINEICVLHPAYRKKLNEAIEKSIK